MKERILSALENLDSENEDHWTSDGLPLVDMVEALVGDTVTRQMIINAAPNFNKKTHSERVRPDFEPKPETIEEIPPLAAIGDPKQIMEFSEYLSEVATENLKELQTRLLLQLDDYTKARDRCSESCARIKENLSMTESRIAVEIPDTTDIEEIKKFLNSQAEERERKVKQRNEILSNIDVSELDPRSELDKAFARDSKRGMKIPA